jgi:hypothetical protein
MLDHAGFERIEFSDREPFWTVLSYKKVKISCYTYETRN